MGFDNEASVEMQRLSYPTETVLSNKITRNIIVLSFKESPRKPSRRRHINLAVCIYRDILSNNGSGFAFLNALT